MCETPPPGGGAHTRHPHPPLRSPQHDLGSRPGPPPFGMSASSPCVIRSRDHRQRVGWGRAARQPHHPTHHIGEPTAATNLRRGFVIHTQRRVLRQGLPSLRLCVCVPAEGGHIITSGAATTDGSESHKTATAELLCSEGCHDCATFSRTRGRGGACNAPLIGVGIAPVAPVGSVPCTTFRDDSVFAERCVFFPRSVLRCAQLTAMPHHTSPIIIIRLTHRGVCWIASALLIAH